MYRLASFLVAGAVIVAGFAAYAEPPANPGDDPPVLLKKKGAPEIDDKDPPLPPADKDKDKKPGDAPKPDADKGGEPEQPQQDADEVLNRVAKNMRRIEEGLANKEIGDGTRQTQDDVLKDLDALIDLTENPPQSKDDKNDSSSSSDSSSSKSDSSKSSSSSSKSSASKSGSSGSSSTSSSKSGQGRSKGSRGGKGKSGSQSGAKGSQPGRGDKNSGDRKPGSQGDQQQDGSNPSSTSGQGDVRGHNDPQMAKDPNADLYKDVWGHLPETLRAEMNAYSNTKGFMPEYEALISKYYSHIAEQGRRKGD